MSFICLNKQIYKPLCIFLFSPFSILPPYSSHFSLKSGTNKPLVTFLFSLFPLSMVSLFPIPWSFAFFFLFPILSFPSSNLFFSTSYFILFYSLFLFSFSFSLFSPIFSSSTLVFLLFVEVLSFFPFSPQK